MVKRALESFAVPGYRMVHAGDIVNDKDPVLKGREALFEDLSEYVDRETGVEQATAAPGEKRAVSQPSEQKRRGRPRKEPAAAEKTEGPS